MNTKFIPRFNDNTNARSEDTNVRSAEVVFSTQKNVYPHCNLTKGRERILIELDEKEGVNSDNLNKYEIVEKYWNLVNDMTNEVAKSIEGLTGRDREKAFISKIWRIIDNKFEIDKKKNLTGFLYEGLNKDELDCDNSSFLVYDIAKQLGINIQIIDVLEHVLVKIHNFCFETTSGFYYPFEKLKEKYNWYNVLEENQMQSITYDNRGVAKAELKDYEGAIEDYNKAIELDPKCAGAYNNRGVAKAKLEDYEEAIEDFDEAIKLNPNDKKAYYNRGIAKFGLGDLKEAIKDYDQAIEINPEYAGAYNNRGSAKTKLKDHKGAIKDYDQAIRINPGYAIAYYNRGVSKIKTWHILEGIKDILKSFIYIYI